MRLEQNRESAPGQTVLDPEDFKGGKDKDDHGKDGKNRTARRTLRSGMDACRRFAREEENAHLSSRWPHSDPT
jgi:hypothetical protein